MKKLVVLSLTVILVLAMSAATFAAVKVTVGGEGNFGYNFASKDCYNGNDGCNFSDWNIQLKADVSDTISFFGKLKSNDLSADQKFETDELTATLKYAPVTYKVGYFGFGFGGSKDILDVPMGDLKSYVGIQAETSFADGFTAKAYIPVKGKKPVSDTEAGAFGLRLDYAKDTYGFGAIYGQSDWKKKGQTPSKTDVFKNATAYTLTGFYKPLKDLKAFVDYSTLTADTEKSGNLDDTDIIIGAYYTPADLPIEVRAEYDMNNENDIAGWTGFNPWGVRFAYKINANTKIEVNRNQKNSSSQETAVKLNVSF